MVRKSEKIRLKKMISDSITVLCRAGLPFQSKFQVEALIGITLDDDEVVLVSFKETMSSNGLTLPSECEDGEEDETEEKEYTTTQDEQNNSVLAVKQNLNSCSAKDEQDNLNWDSSTNYNNPDGSSHFSSVQALKDFDKIHRTQQSTTVNSNGNENQDQRETLELEEQTDFDLNHEDRSYPSNDQYDQTFVEIKNKRSFKEQIKIEIDDIDDNADCMIVKSEESNINECYDLDDGQPWSDQADVFNGNHYSDFEAMQSSDGMSSAYSQESAWMPKRSKPAAKKLKLPLPSQKQLYMTKPSSTFTNFKHLQLATKPVAKPSEPVIIEGAENAIGNDVIGRPVMQCTYCNAVFNKSHVLKEHVNGVHFKKKLFHCPDCGESFKWRAELSRHRRIPGMCPCRGVVDQDWPGQY